MSHELLTMVKRAPWMCVIKNSFNYTLLRIGIEKPFYNSKDNTLAINQRKGGEAKQQGSL